MRKNLFLFAIFSLWLAMTPGRSLAADIAVRAVTLPTAERPVVGRLFAAPGDGKRPAVILLHGRQGIDRFQDFYERYALALAQAGMDAYLLSYYEGTDLEEANAQDKTARQALFQRRVQAWSLLVRDVVGDILARKECSGSVGLLGFSQGGFLATAVAGQDARLAALVVFYGGVPSVFKDTITHLPPLLALHGDADNTVPLPEGKALVDLGRRLGQSAEMVVFPGAGHGFGGRDADEAERRTIAFLRKQLVKKTP